MKLKPADWMPPGGTTNDLRELGKSQREPGSTHHPRDEGAIMLASADELAHDARACVVVPEAVRADAATTLRSRSRPEDVNVNGVLPAE